MTQIEFAKKNIITKEMEFVAKNENIDLQSIKNNLIEGTLVIPKNKLHDFSNIKAIGKGVSIKINANIGTSKGYSSLSEELEKMNVAIKYGADAIMVLSTWGDIQDIRKTVVEISPVPVGSVPVYDAAVKSVKSGKKVTDFSEKDFIDMFLMHAKDGVDFTTIHAGINFNVLEYIKKSNRILKIVSRGGSIIAGWMIVNKKENPFYSHFDEILDIAREYDVTLSLGDGMRPGAIVDGSDPQQFEELFVIAELIDMAKKKDVQVIVEGPGHISIDMIETNVKLMKSICKNVPIFLLGPIVIDNAPGYDHLTSAIGGAFAAYFGADFLCYVTPAEHLALPDIEDVKEGVIASKIAAIAGDVSRNNKQAMEIQKQMAIARRDFNWDKMFSLSVNPDKAKDYREKRSYDEDKGCSICGPFCAIKIVKDYIS